MLCINDKSKALHSLGITITEKAAYTHTHTYIWTSQFINKYFHIERFRADGFHFFFTLSEQYLCIVCVKIEVFNYYPLGNTLD